MNTTIPNQSFDIETSPNTQNTNLQMVDVNGRIPRFPTKKESVMVANGALFWFGGEGGIGGRVQYGMYIQKKKEQRNMEWWRVSWGNGT